MTQLAGVRALVTGASSGIGAEVAAALAQTGAAVTVAGRDADRLGAVASRVGGVPVTADLRDGAALRGLLDRCAETDVLVSNAGVGWAGAFTEMPEEQAERLLDVNLAAAVRLARGLVPGMVRRGRGHLVLVSSIAAVGVRDEAVYSATKSGLRAFGEALRYELAGSGVAVSVVFPGVVETPFFVGRGRPYDRSRPRPVRPSRVAAAVVDAIRAERAEVYVPGWLAIAARVQGALPGFYRTLAGRFG